MTAKRATRSNAGWAADQFVEVWSREFTSESPDLNVVRAAVAGVVDALEVVATPAQVEAVQQLTTQSLAVYEQRTGGTGAVQVEAVPARHQAHARLPQICAALDLALVDFDNKKALAAAEREITELEARYESLLTDLQSAVAASDVPKVMALRGEAEVSLPAQLGTARSKVMALRIEEAEAVAPAPARRLEQFTAQTRSAEQELAEATRRLGAANDNLRVAQLMEFEARGISEDAAGKAAALREERVRAEQQREHDQNRRLRKLAGLDDLQVGA